MQRNILRTIIALVVTLISANQATAQTPNPFPKMAPLDQYLIADRNAEIALARSAAPASVAKDAKVLVMGKSGYETAVQGKNGFVCIVLRSWMGPDSNDFWNPKVRSPLCFNASGARYYLPINAKRTELALAGRSKAQIFDGIKAAFDKKEFPQLETGASCFMLSKQGYLNDAGGPWHSHVMFFAPLNASTADWGADLPGSPIISGKDTSSRMTVFMVPVAKWSDGTTDTAH
jgi:hypothetical protein